MPAAKKAAKPAQKAAAKPEAKPAPDNESGVKISGAAPGQTTPVPDQGPVTVPAPEPSAQPSHGVSIADISDDEADDIEYRIQERRKRKERARRRKQKLLERQESTICVAVKAIVNANGKTGSATVMPLYEFPLAKKRLQAEASTELELERQYPANCSRTEEMTRERLNDEYARLRNKYVYQGENHQEKSFDFITDVYPTIAAFKEAIDRQHEAWKEIALELGDDEFADEPEVEELEEVAAAILTDSMAELDDGLMML